MCESLCKCLHKISEFCKFLNVVFDNYLRLVANKSHGFCQLELHLLLLLSVELCVQVQILFILI